MANARRPQQAAAIAIRRKGDAIQVCLIRRRDSGSWGIPKGTIDPGNTPEETALNEAWEEAGLEGRVLGEAIGTYEYEKWYTTLRVAVFVMEVVEEHGEWLESDIGSDNGLRLLTLTELGRRDDRWLEEETFLSPSVNLRRL